MRPAAASRHAGEADHQPKYKGFRAAHLIAHPDEILNTLETDQPYPLKMAWFYATNGIANTTNAQGKRWYKALQKMEFNVVQDVFMTPTAMGLCDLFLPVTTFANTTAWCCPTSAGTPTWSWP